MLRACHGPPPAGPAGGTWSKLAVAWVAAPRLEPWNVSGEVTNSPMFTVAGRPARWAVPMGVQVVPLLDSKPVIVSPVRVSRSQRGDELVTAPARPAWSWM